MELEVAGKELTSIVSETTFQEKFPEAQLSPSQVILKTYTGEPMKIIGTLSAPVRYAEYGAGIFS